MEPQILDYEDGRLLVTKEAYMIPETRALIEKYEKDVEPYLAYLHLMTWLRSPYRAFDINDREENVIFDVTQTVGNFDIDEPLLKPALEKLIKMNTTALTSFFLEVEQELHRMRVYLRDNPISDGREGNLADRFRILKEAGAIVASYGKSKQAAEEEIKIKGRGKAQIGDY